MTGAKAKTGAGHAPWPRRSYVTDCVQSTCTVVHVHLYVHALLNYDTVVFVVAPEPSARGKGCGKEALLAMMYYGQ